VTNQPDLWRDSIVKINTPIRVAIERLNKVGIKIALVLDDNYRLLGTISDGDFRRGILSGLSLEDTVEKIMNKNPRTVSEGAGRLEILKVMTDTRIFQIPIIDKNSFVIGLHLWDDISVQAKYSNIMVIMQECQF
jgi:CBS domain-containing protein